MPNSILKNKKVLLGLTGGIALYKIPELIRRLKERGADVTALMTRAACRFIPPLTFETLTGKDVFTDPFSTPLSHIDIPGEADVFLIAPATADIIGKLASGLGDDMVSLSFLVFRGPVLVAPAMNSRMYDHPVVRRNLEILKEMGVVLVDPEEGALACGESGKGRLASIETIIEALESALTTKDLSGRRVVVTAGPTREYLDPVRYISNRSSGKMGYAVARVAARRGADVTLISGPTHLELPPFMEGFRQVETTDELLAAVKDEVQKGADLLVMAAAVSDFTPSQQTETKISRKELSTLSLRKTPDIISAISGMPGRPFIIGFAAETGPEIAKARGEMHEKGMDMVVFNDVTEEGAGFDHDTNKITIIDRQETVSLPLMSKEECARKILDFYIKKTS